MRNIPCSQQIPQNGRWFGHSIGELLPHSIVVQWWSITYPLFLKRAQKTSPEPPRRKSIHWALMPSTPMKQFSKFKRVMVRFVFSISANPWPNETVQGRPSNFTLDSHQDIYSPWAQVHHTSVPASRKLLCAKLMLMAVLFNFKAVAKAWPPWNAFRVILMQGMNMRIQTNWS